jgi:wyosine [tRNA(Phe)-imidazoG37] synthetase (radical SAM superfamily)
LFYSHPRTFQSNRFVYPVLSRRSGGISIGLNLNPDRICNFHCVYCQIDRSRPAVEKPFVELPRLVEELDAMIELVTSGQIYEGTQFEQAPGPLHRLNDIAMSGDGEPTTYTNFCEVAEVCAEARRRHRLDDVKLVLITNASMLHRDAVRRGLAILDANNGEIWAKLDAGTEDYYRQVARGSVPFGRILENLADAARTRPIVIQSLFMRMHGQPPSAAEQAAYCDRLCEIVAAGGRIKLVQIHTVARPPAESWAAPLRSEEVDALAELVRARTGLPVAAFYGSGG